MSSPDASTPNSDNGHGVQRENLPGCRAGYAGLWVARFDKRHNPIHVERNISMRSASRLLGFVCVLLTAVLWAVTVMTDPTPGPIAAAAALTVIVAAMIALTSWK
jgi:hypothetical protein